jgi:Family of unknown function (DUF6325)
MIGPVQVVVVGFDRPNFSGEVLSEFARLRAAGIVRLLDLLLISRDEDGTLQTVDIPAEIATDFGQVAAALLGQPDNADADQDRNVAQLGDIPAWSLADAVPVGSIAAVALIEHTWAAPLRDAIQKAGGTPLEETWLGPDDLELVEGLAANR